MTMLMMTNPSHHFVQQHPSHHHSKKCCDLCVTILSIVGMLSASAALNFNVAIKQHQPN